MTKADGGREVKKSGGLSPAEAICRDLQTLKYHGRFVRTGLSARFANFVRETAMATTIDPIRVETVIPRSDDQRAVAIDVDAIRGRPGPGELSSPLSV